MPLLIRVLLFGICFLIFGAKNIWACSVSVSPNFVTMGNSSISTFTVTNSSELMGNWVRIQSPGLTAYTVANMQAAGWYPNGGGTEANFAGGYLEGGTSSDFALTLAETGEITDSMSWEALLSYDDGANFESCGSVTLQIVPAPAAPTISNVSMTVGNASASLTWSTNLTSTGVVNYGTTASYGNTKSTTSNTSHQATLTGLSASTLYHYQIQVTSEGGTTSTQDATFTTSAADVITVTTTTVTNTVTTTTIITPTPTPKPASDTIAPVVTISTDFAKPFLAAPTIQGKAIDGGLVNIGVAQVEYSLDKGKNWLPVDFIDTPGKKSSTFEFTPVGLEDGNYFIKVRAKDSTGNIGTSKLSTMVIDRLPPQIGGSIFSLGPIIFKPDNKGNIYSITGLPLRLALSAVGGPTNINITYDSNNFSLIKNEESGLWTGNILTNQAGTYPVTTNSIDGAQNKTTRNLSTIISLSPGMIKDEQHEPLPNAKISVYIYNKFANDYLLWDSNPYLQLNPQTTDLRGTYFTILPPGKYFIEIEAKGFQKLRTEIFEISDSTPFTQIFTLPKARYFCNWWAQTIPVSLPQVAHSSETVHSLVGKPVPDFDLSISENIFNNTSILGKPTIISFFSTWQPQTSDQIQELNNLKLENDGINIFPVAIQESNSKTEIFKKTGGHILPISADPDGIFVLPLNLSSLPTHIFIDRKGIIKEVTVGFLDKDNLLNKILK